jgi:predicted ATP-grasp superfamily ATP-dependent carboligase
VILVGGDANALSVARDLGRQGVDVFALEEPDVSVGYSRYCRRIALSDVGSGNHEDAWAEFLLGPASDPLRGAVVLACSDAAIQLLVRHRPALLERFRLDLCDPAAQLAMLDKLTTYELARRAGVPTPRFWTAATREQVVALERELLFPLMIKPRLSHVFQQKFGRKHVVVASFAELLAAYETVEASDAQVLLVEQIPGSDDRLCSYFTYLDERGTPLLHFTKRVIRRYPVGMGGGTYHVTAEIPELRELALPLFRQVGLRGLVNVEFKLDERDGRYKLIECNARFVASDGLVSASGISLGTFVYNRVTGRPLPQVDAYRSGLRQWDPARDFYSFRELRRAGQLTAGQWLRSVARRQTFAYFRWTDPLPALARVTLPLRRRLRRSTPERSTRSAPAAPAAAAAAYAKGAAA